MQTLAGAPRLKSLGVHKRSREKIEALNGGAVAWPVICQASTFQTWAKLMTVECSGICIHSFILFPGLQWIPNTVDTMPTVSWRNLLGSPATFVPPSRQQ